MITLEARRGQAADEDAWAAVGSSCWMFTVMPSGASSDCTICAAADSLALPDAIWSVVVNPCGFDDSARAFLFRSAAAVSFAPRWAAFAPQWNVASDRLSLLRELSLLLRAGLSVERALSAMQGLTAKARLKSVLAQLLEGLRAGEALSSAMRRVDRLFPETMRKLIAAGGQFCELLAHVIGRNLDVIGLAATNFVRGGRIGGEQPSIGSIGLGLDPDQVAIGGEA